MANNINFLDETIEILKQNNVDVDNDKIAVMLHADGSINTWEWFKKKANFFYQNKGGTIIISRSLEIGVAGKGYLTRVWNVEKGHEWWVWNADETIDFTPKDHYIPLCYY